MPGAAPVLRTLAPLSFVAFTAVTPLAHANIENGGLARAGIEHGGLSFRLSPLLGWMTVRSRVRADHQEPNRATLLNLPQDESVIALGVNARAGWGWPVGSSYLMLGLAYSFARGQAERDLDTSLDSYRFTLQPNYHSGGLTFEALLAERLLGVEMTLGTGSVDGNVTSELDGTRGTRKSGYLFGAGWRGRFLTDSAWAVSLGMYYEILGFFPRVLDDQWHNGDLFSVRLGLEFDAARGGER